MNSPSTPDAAPPVSSPPATTPRADALPVNGCHRWRTHRQRNLLSLALLFLVLGLLLFGHFRFSTGGSLLATEESEGEAQGTQNATSVLTPPENPLTPEDVLTLSGLYCYDWNFRVNYVFANTANLLDSDGDGVPDIWENDILKSDATRADGNEFSNGTVFTNLELYYFYRAFFGGPYTYGNVPLSALADWGIQFIPPEPDELISFPDTESCPQPAYFYGDFYLGYYIAGEGDDSDDDGIPDSWEENFFRSDPFGYDSDTLASHLFDLNTGQPLTNLELYLRLRRLYLGIGAPATGADNSTISDEWVQRLTGYSGDIWTWGSFLADNYAALLAQYQSAISVLTAATEAHENRVITRANGNSSTAGGTATTPLNGTNSGFGTNPTARPARPFYAVVDLGPLPVLNYLPGVLDSPIPCTKLLLSEKNAWVVSNNFSRWRNGSWTTLGLAEQLSPQKYIVSDIGCDGVVLVGVSSLFAWTSMPPTFTPPALPNGFYWNAAGALTPAPSMDANPADPTLPRSMWGVKILTGTDEPDSYATPLHSDWAYQIATAGSEPFPEYVHAAEPNGANFYCDYEAFNNSRWHLHGGKPNFTWVNRTGRILYKDDWIYNTPYSYVLKREN
ncbi:MAG: hypothetical protein LBR07_01800 [Puniceicoccales bacterium]|jgi:hypothetical protein|nr:hypothetical protein [Puniceicoccales bacterium]